MRLKTLDEKVMAQDPESRGREGGRAPALSLTLQFSCKADVNVDAVTKHSTDAANPEPTQHFHRAVP